MMNCAKYLVIFAFCTVSIKASFSNDRVIYTASSIPAQLLSNANAVVRLDETRFSIKNIGHGIEYHHFVITVLNKNGDKFANFIEGYDKFIDISFTEGSIFNTQGERVKKIKESDLRDFSATDYSLFSDNRVKAFEPAWGQYPYTIEYIYEIGYTGLLNYPEWIPLNEEDLAIEHAEYIVQVPDGINVRFKEFNLTHQESTNTERKLKIYSWKLDTIQAISYEVFSPQAYNYLPLVILAPEGFEIDVSSGNLGSWNSFGKWIQDIHNQEDILSPETQKKVIDLASTASTNREKVRKIYEFMQSKTRYVSVQLGIGGWRPFPAGIVDKNAYGDCKALANYMQALLRVVDIPSYYTLIHGGNDPGFIFKDFSYNGFNHAILCVPDGKDTIWLECTSQTNPFGYTAGFTDNRYALVIGEKGGTLVRTRHYSQKENTRDLHAVIIIEDNGDGNADIITQYKGYQYEMREQIIPMNPSDQKKYIYDHTGIQNIDVGEWNYSQEKDVVPVITEKLKLNIKGMVTISDDRAYFTPNQSNRWKILPSNFKKRKTEVWLQRSTTDIDSIVYLIPQGLEVEYLPTNIIITNKFGSLTVSMNQYSGAIVFYRVLKFNEGLYSIEDYNAFADFLKQIARTDGEKVVLKK